MCRRSLPFQATIEGVFRIVVFGIFLLQLILIVSAASAQDASTGALRGVVLDAHGALITNADIVAIRVETGARYHSATDSAGRFAVDLLPPGQYSARAEAEGMSPQISPVIRVEVGAASFLTFKLKVAGRLESITVSEAPRVIDGNPSSVSARGGREGDQGFALERAPVHGSFIVDARGYAGSSRTDVRIQRRSVLWRNSRIQHELSGRWWRRQQRIFCAGVRAVSCPISVFERGSAGVPGAVERLWRGVGPGRRRGGECGNEIRIESVARKRVLLFARQFAGRSGSRVCWFQPQQSSASVWRNHRRPDSA